MTTEERIKKEIDRFNKDFTNRPIRKRAFYRAIKRHEPWALMQQIQKETLEKYINEVGRYGFSWPQLSNKLEEALRFYKQIKS